LCQTMKHCFGNIVTYYVLACYRSSDGANALAGP
jgi:hypothetical protein